MVVRLCQPDFKQLKEELFVKFMVSAHFSRRVWENRAAHFTVARKKREKE